MDLAFYYHIPITLKNNELYLPGYFGVFIDSLSIKVNKLYLVMHQSKPRDDRASDYALKSKNIIWINLGIKTPAWHRAIFHQKILKNALMKIEQCDAFLIRSPSPLAPYFPSYVKKPILFFMIVGDYGAEADKASSKGMREWLMWKYIKYNDMLFIKAIRNQNLLVNSPDLYNKYLPLTNFIQQIKTTTLSKSDFYKRTDTCTGKVINLLYTGRIDPMKGLFELLDAFFKLCQSRRNLILHFVGWEDDIKKPVETALRLKAKNLRLNDKVIFHGKKKLGDELNQFYRMGDIYILPSHHEGFPRTIWEAMANSLPVIATNVGGIPQNLHHRKNAFLINPQDSELITNAVEEILTNIPLRKRMILNGFEAAKENTLNVQSERIINFIKTACKSE